MTKLALLSFLVFVLVLPTIYAEPTSVEDYFCDDNPTFLQRLVSRCKIPDNNICDDGEYVFIDKDCKGDFNAIRSGEFLKQMWFVRLCLLLAIYFFFNRNDKYQLIILGAMVLLIYNGAFVQPGYQIDETACLDVNFIQHLGYCVVPQHQLLGWALSLILVVVLVNYFLSPKRNNQQPYRNRKVYK